MSRRERIPRKVPVDELRSPTVRKESAEGDHHGIDHVEVHMGAFVKAARMPSFTYTSG